MKRVFDLSLSALALLVLAPLMASVAVIVRFAVGAPVLFRQVRPGLRARPFTLLKFRTMRDEFDRNGHALADADRLTPFGRFLREISLDELPQLWNVLRGDMSLVGPRPLLIEYLPRYTPQQLRRHDVRPGITGWAQIHGRNALGWADRLRMDVWYVEHRSLWLDLRILAATLRIVFSRQGISQPGKVTVEKFRGSPECTESEGPLESGAAG